jgi:hypothetical protein
VGEKPATVTPQEYCRAIEDYLCRKNDGHLVRIVGPSFERVCAWAEQGVPFRIACQGIDTYFLRYYAKGARRRPVQIDFCEHDVLDAFDAWRRAVGVRLPDAESEGGEPSAKASSTRSLPAHLDRVCQRLTEKRAGMTPLPDTLDAVLDTITREAAGFRDSPGPIRGDVRQGMTARLVELDRMMIDAARATVDPAALQLLRAEASDQLRPFRDRMPADAYSRALDAAVDRLIREREQLPTIAFE